MIEAKKTEFKETLNAFADELIALAKEAEENPETVLEALHKMIVGRPGEGEQQDTLCFVMKKQK
ncbi:hypothetical protein A8F95_15150 [Bacillus wudalianchiensis]|uniref:Uncharacterized protein n=1 Tax=Pseudobacillus wudalianchiensis TaxID=1743143 RepID=A0A1B9ADV9_9BACI|nr:hypothetical protein A8F95_15150 [Bacillus wudalianchiensis]